MKNILRSKLITWEMIKYDKFWAIEKVLKKNFNKIKCCCGEEINRETEREDYCNHFHHLAENCDLNKKIEQI